MEKLILGIISVSLLSTVINLNAGFEPSNWPDQFSNGAFSTKPYGTVSDDIKGTIKDYPNAINAICNYSEGQADWVVNGATDELKIKFPASAFVTLNFAYMQKDVVPVIIFYTTNWSESTPKMIRDFEQDNMAKHFANLIIDCQLIGYMHSKFPEKPIASMIINPDFLAELQKNLYFLANQKALTDNNTWTATDANDFVKNALGTELKVTKALQKAVYFCEKSKLPWKTKSLTPIFIVEDMCSTVIGNEGTIPDWDSKSTTGFKDQFEALMKSSWASIKDSDYQSQAIPAEITNDFTGYIQAVNYLVKEKTKFDANGAYAGKESATFGWSGNNWAVSYGKNLQGAQWIHTNADFAKIKTYAAQMYDTWNNLKVYSGNWAGDFIAFDKYERNSFAVINGEDYFARGWLWNQEEWLDYLEFIKYSTVALNKPALLFQIPGGHLGSDVTDRSKMSTEPQFFFGDSEFSIPTSVADLKLSGEYKTRASETVSAFLTKNWSNEHITDAVNSNIFAIIWGGGTTTSIGNYPATYADGGWLADKIDESPMKHLLPTALSK